MYHDVQPDLPPPTGGPERLTVSKASFELMLDAVAASGYEGCSLEEARAEAGNRRIAITFDDGTMGQYEHAVPALRDRGMTATFFVVTDWVGRTGFMSWDELRLMKKWGMSIQSHSKSHPHLSELTERDLRRELEESRRELDAKLDQRTTEIALPGGNAPKFLLRRILGESGYEAVANSRWGANPQRSRRVPRWIRRCNVPQEIDEHLASRIVAGDLGLVVRHYSREALLNSVRALLGAGRYARWRRSFLNFVSQR
jgi:peptidoglycan/xylan/chitin deacetylase (PgdA/CDA1 family)